MDRMRIALPEAFIGLGTLAFAGLVLWQTEQIPVSPLYAKVGPRVLPYITTGGIALLGALLLWRGLRGGWQPEEEKEVAPDWRAVAVLTVALVANVTLIGPLGFSLASTILFVLVAYAFGDRHVVRNAGIGLVLALLAYFGFARTLGVNIGAGFLENLLGG
ncbi:tripartite tricarboxylate transporter TctB family protein [Salinarimonas soli]|uniref:Tripartite tricarboxylate transporter TctB family protein n=1 Tax=Salinarimonas soli TaxID=1638099 RepID=A0A5B2V9T3_9HYPH|nr:tripartite tricarboxylate transporter TctB family protein [Salinarimonas soli]KAA2235771.1 tripartite tricarboxylate transporter TctB family protein [Salinarimonas soli]